MSLKPLTGAKRLRELLKDPEKLVLCPGVYDGLTARLALSIGFDAIYMVFHSQQTRVDSSLTTNRLEQEHQCQDLAGQTWG